MKTTYVIVSKGNNKFWNGTTWSAEYPSAAQYLRKGLAIKVCDTAKGIGAEGLSGMNVIENYGLDDEQIVYSVEPKF